MNLGSIVSLDRTAGTAVLVVSDDSREYHLALGTNEVRQLPTALAQGDRVSLEVSGQEGSLALVISRAAAGPS
jgi:hypothetical protein